MTAFDRSEIFLGLEATGDWLYFSVRGTSGQLDLWRSDGSAGGAQPVVQFAPGGGLEVYRWGKDIEILGEHAIMVASLGPGSLDVDLVGSRPGSTSGVSLLDCAGGCPNLLSNLEAFAGAALFITGSGDESRPTELWRTDGTLAGTARVAQLCATGCPYDEVQLSPVGEEVGFVYGGRVWLTDGTVAGTRAITGPAVRAQGPRRFISQPEPAVGRAGKCWLFAAHGPAGLEPWCSTGTAASARLLLDINTAEASSHPDELTRLGDLALFSALDADGVRQVWASDGDPESPERLRQITSASFAYGESRKLFAGEDFALFEDRLTPNTVWRTDGTVAGTFPVGSLERYGSDVALHGRIYSVGAQGSDFGIWELDGSSGGLRLVVPVPIAGAITSLIPTGAGYFLIDLHDELWHSDGTAGGTWRVMTTPPVGRLTVLLPRAELGGWVYFVVDYDGLHEELWRTDGSRQGARRVGTIPALRAAQHGGAGSALHAHRGALFFFGETFPGAYGTTLYRWDSTGATPLATTPFWHDGYQFVSLDRWLYFAFSDPVHGTEVWRSDGTAAGTAPVADLHEAGSSRPYELTVAGGRLVFTAVSARGGAEIYAVEPSGAVVQITEIAPGPLSSSPRQLVATESALFFTAEDAEAGREPWALPLGPAVGPEPPEPPPGAYLTSPEVPGFRFKVRISIPAGSLAGAREPGCIPETLCVSGALPGRSEVFLRVVGPKPNGKLWPTLVKFSTSRVEVWVEQTASGELRYYDLAGAAPGDDRLPGLFDREGFEPLVGAAPGGGTAGGALRSQRTGAGLDAFGLALTSPALPGFTFRVEVRDPQGQPSPVRVESACIEETVCLSAALPGRSELFLRLVGPKPNGHLWPTLVRFSTSTIDVWITQTSTGIERHYRLEGATPGSSDLSGLFDCTGFLP